MLNPGSYTLDEYNAGHPSAARITTIAGQIACGFTTVFYAACSAGVSAYSTAVMGGGYLDIIKSAAASYLTASVGQYYGDTWNMERVFASGLAGGVAALTGDLLLRSVFRLSDWGGKPRRLRLID